MNLSNNPMYKALKAHYQAKKLKALANIEVFMKAPVGVGEHSDLVSTICTQVEELAHAEDVLYCIESHYEGDDED